jgi:Skp family chaperone for outer membrane proteins
MKILFVILLYGFSLINSYLFAEGVSGSNKLRSDILVLSQDELFKKSVPGKEIIKIFEKKQTVLFLEARDIEQTFILEERELTDKRLNLEPEEFQVLADEFDLRVEATRKSRADKDRALQKNFTRWRKNFVQIVLPIVRNIMTEFGAVAVLDTGSRGFVYDQKIDITQRLILELNQEFLNNPTIINQIISKN